MLRVENLTFFCKPPKEWRWSGSPYRLTFTLWQNLSKTFYHGWLWRLLLLNNPPQKYVGWCWMSFFKHQPNRVSFLYQDIKKPWWFSAIWNILLSHTVLVSHNLTFQPCSLSRSLATEKTRWNPRTRMPTRMLRNRDNTYLSHIPTSPLVGHPDLTHWGDTLVGHPCLTLLRNALVKHFYLTLLWDTLAWQFFWGTLTWHSCRTLLTWHFLLDTLTWGSCKTFILDTSYLTLLWDTLTWHFLLEILTWHSCRTLLPDTLVRHSYLTLL